MAKATALQLLTKVQENLGEIQSTSMGSLTGLALLIFNTFNEVLLDIATEYKLQPNECDISLSLAAGVNTYTASIALVDFDKDSFNYNDERPISYYTKQTIDRERRIRTSTGIPNVVFYWGEKFTVDPIPADSEDSKQVKFGAWKVPDLLSTDSPTGTSYIPEGFDLTMLANIVTFKILAYKGNQEAQVYFAKVYGTADGKLEGQWDKFKRAHGSPQILDENIMVEPMGRSNKGGTRFVQPPIIG